MPHFMLDREVIVPPEYASRSCILVKYRLPLLPHCFVLCHEPQAGVPQASPPDLVAFFWSEAGRLALESAGNAETFMLIHSGASIRKRPNLHVHVFIVERRWQKSWLYTVLGAKNAALALYNLVSRTRQTPQTKELA